MNGTIRPAGISSQEKYVLAVNSCPGGLYGAYASGVTFGANLKKAREAKGLTQIQLARLMGYEASSGNSPISGWETEDKVPSPEMVVRFAEVLGVGTWKLLEGVVTEIDRLRQKPPDLIRQGGAVQSPAGGERGQSPRSGTGTERAGGAHLQTRKAPDANARLREENAELRTAIEAIAKVIVRFGAPEAKKAHKVAPRKSGRRRSSR